MNDAIPFLDNLLCIIEEFETSYMMKGVGKPQYYLGGDIVNLPAEWEKEGIGTAFSAWTYIKNCISILEKLCREEQFKTYKTSFKKD